jgi:hypothetical protein
MRIAVGQLDERKHQKAQEQQRVPDALKEAEEVAHLTGVASGE